MPFRRARRPFGRSLRISHVFAAASLAIFLAVANAARAEAPPRFAPDIETLTKSQPNATVETLPGGYRIVIPANTDGEAVDPRFKMIFSRTVYVYAERTGDAPAKGLYRTVTLHGDNETVERLTRYARLTARLLHLHRERFGRDAIFGRNDETADVWLPAGPSPVPGAAAVGGETHGSEVYIWATKSATRTPLEWTRTLVHEWGHLTLSAARGFHDPEGDAAGFLGERLYMKWLDEDTRSKPMSADDGTTSADLALYHRRQIAPLIARWNREGAGPKSSLLIGTDTAAMDYYIGMALAADDAFGSAILGRALVTILDTRPRDLLQSLARVIAETPVPTVRLPAWIPMQQGYYMLKTADSRTEGAVSFSREAPPVTLSSSRPPVRQKILLTGWKFVLPLHGNVVRIQLKRVTDEEGQP